MRLRPVSLIIPSRNRPEMLYDTVKSILEGEEQPDELIIIDQSDNPNATLSTLESDTGCVIRYVWEHSVGLSRARNVGVSLACYAMIAFTDDDVIVAPTWFGNLVNALIETGPGGVVTGRVLPIKDAASDGFTPSIKEDEEAAIYSGRVGEDVLFPLNMAMFASTLTLIGLFDVRLGAGSTFPGAEDNDFGFRLLEAGYQICYVPDAILYHRAWRTARQYLSLRWDYGYGQGAFYAKYFSLHDRYMIARMWSDITRHAGRWFQYGWKRSFRQNYGELVYISGLIYGAARWTLTQRKTA